MIIHDHGLDHLSFTSKVAGSILGKKFLNSVLTCKEYKSI